MARTLTGAIKASLGLTYLGDTDLGEQKALLPFAAEMVVSSGTGANQCDLAFWDNRTLAISTAEDLDLAGGLIDHFGLTLTFVEICGIWIKAGSANGGNIVVGGDATAAFVGPFGGATDTIEIPAGQTALVTNLGAGWPVTATTGDILQIANDDAGAAATYDIAIIGRSA